MLQSFTRNYEDKSNENGFQFIFKCDVCGDGYESGFIGSKAAKKKSFFNKVSQFGGAVSNNAYLAGALGGQAYQTPEWNKERETAFQQASNEGMSHFQRCPRCHKYVCDADWNDGSGLCSNDAPMVASEVNAASAQTAKDQIWEQAKTKPMYSGDLSAQQTVCPSCGKVSGGGKFCNNCGTQLGMKKCAGCGTENPPTVNFCGSCGSKL
ncbi:MAG: zinc ribbon domain-containing protein [Nitrososphaerales archaeon]